MHVEDISEGLEVTLQLGEVIIHPGLTIAVCQRLVWVTTIHDQVSDVPGLPSELVKSVEMVLHCDEVKLAVLLGDHSVLEIVYPDTVLALKVQIFRKEREVVLVASAEDDCVNFLFRVISKSDRVSFNFLENWLLRDFPIEAHFNPIAMHIFLSVGNDDLFCSKFMQLTGNVFS